METNILDTIDKNTLGKELQTARKRAGLTQEEAAQAIDAARTTIVAIEKGERRIKAGELLKLAQAFGRSPSDFVRPRPKLESFYVQFRGPYQRTLEDNTEISPKIDEFEDFCRDYLELEQLMESPLSRKYPTEYSVSGIPLEQAADEVAKEERNRLRLGDGPLLNLRGMLEQEVGLRIFYIPLPAKFSAIYFYTESLGGCIAVNSLHPFERQRMSLAHDYGHFLTTRISPTLDMEEYYQRLPESERFANTFASDFLMPSEGLTRRINDIRKTQGKIILADLLRLAHYYGVSFDALTYRLEESKLLPTGTGKSLKENGLRIREAQRQLGLDATPLKEETFPQRYQLLAINALESGLITEGRFARFLRVDRLEARRIAATFQKDNQEIPVSGDSQDLDLAQVVSV